MVLVKLSVQIDPGDLARVQEKLEKLDQATNAKARSRALNEGLDRMRTEAVRRIGAKLPSLEKARIRREVKFFRSNLSTLSADLEVSQLGIPLINYAVGATRSLFRRTRTARKKGLTAPNARTPRSGVVVSVKKGPKEVPGAFVQKPSKGGLFLFSRSGTPQARKRGVGGPVRPRYPIRALFGPSILNVFQDEAAAVAEIGQSVVFKELERQIDGAVSN